MNFIYMGTAEIAVQPLYALIAAGHNAVCVLTQPDKVNARGNKVVFSAVKQAACELNIPISQPQKASSEESYRYLKALNADVCVVCAYGQLLKTNILNMNRYGCLNLHASLLPEYRGASPIQRAIQNGEKTTGVTVMYMNEGLDTGDMMIKSEVKIGDDMTYKDLTKALSLSAASLVVEAFELLSGGNAPRTPQPCGDFTYAEKITKEECVIDFNQPSRKVFNMVRSLDPTPGAQTQLNGKIIKIFSVALEPEKEQEPPAVPAGTLMGIVKQSENKPYCGLKVACGIGEIIIQTLKPEGKQLMKATDFYNGLRLKDGAVFGKNNG